MRDIRKVILLTLLCGCATGVDPDQLADRYQNFGCEDLKQEYRYVLEKRVDAFNQRMQQNNTHLIVNSTIGVLTGSGKTEFADTSDIEKNAETVLKVLRQEMKKKGCGNQGACK